MLAHQVSAREGWGWLVEGFRLFRRNPPLLTFLLFSWWALVVLASAIPVVGSVAATIFMPAFSVSLMNGCSALAEERRGGLDLLFSGFRRNLPALVRLGVIYVGLTAGVLLASSLMDGGALMNFMLSGKLPDEDMIGTSTFTGAAFVATLLSLPLMMAYWFAPLLAGWDDVPPAKSLFFSFMATLQNWRPFLAYGAALALFGAVVPALVMMLALGISGPVFSVVRVVVAMVLGFVFVPTVFASFYVSYHQIFRDNQPDAPADTAA